MSNIDGFEVARRLRTFGSKGRICIHSNRGVLDYHKQAFEAGADGFLPKPISRMHLFNLLEAGIRSNRPQANHSTRHLVVVDDSPFIQERWCGLSELGIVKTYASPEKFLEALIGDHKVLTEARAVVADYFFEDNSKMNGLDFLQYLRLDQKFDGPLYLRSDADLEISDPQIIRLPKDPDLAAAKISLR